MGAGEGEADLQVTADGGTGEGRLGEAVWACLSSGIIKSLARFSLANAGDYGGGGHG